MMRLLKVKLSFYLYHEYLRLTKLILMNWCAHMLGHVRLFVTPEAVARQAPLSMRFSRQEYWSGLPFPPPGDLPDPGIQPTSLLSPALAGGFFTTSTAWETLMNWSWGPFILWWTVEIRDFTRLADWWVNLPAPWGQVEDRRLLVGDAGLLFAAIPWASVPTSMHKVGGSHNAPPTPGTVDYITGQVLWA